MDALLLSRIQFGFTIVAHIIFPAFSMGLILFLLVVEGLWLKTKSAIYETLFLFWTKIFAVSFGMGVATGVPMAIQFGSNWSVFSQFASPVIFTLFSVEVLTAFFLESIFLGVMLFGWNKVKPWQHFCATLFVFVGVHNSAFWILAGSSWMHTPDGTIVSGGILKVVDWMKVIFTPSMYVRWPHMWLASYISSGLFVAGVSSFYVMRGLGGAEHGRVALKVVLPFLSLVILAQPLVGDMHGLNTFKYNPAKVAAIEGLWETTSGAPLVLFAIPDEESERNRFEVAIPKVSSLLLTHSLNGTVKGLKDFPKDERPSSVKPVFYAFRVMVGIGLLLCLVPLLYFWSSLRPKFTLPGVALRYFLMLSMPLGFVATVCGWIVTEMGRQPWMIYGIMKVSDSASPLKTSEVALSLLGFAVVYLALYLLSFYYLFKLVRIGPSGGWSSSQDYVT